MSRENISRIMNKPIASNGITLGDIATVIPSEEEQFDELMHGVLYEDIYHYFNIIYPEIIYKFTLFYPNLMLTMKTICPNIFEEFHKLFLDNLHNNAAMERIRETLFILDYDI